MRVEVTRWSGDKPREMSLEDALCPKSHGSDGAVEHARDLANECANALGKFAARLVEKNVLTLEEAQDICGIGSTIEVVK